MMTYYIAKNQGRRTNALGRRGCDGITDERKDSSEIFKNLYFVGAGTHPGAGMPGVLSSAKVLDKLFK